MHTRSHKFYGDRLRGTPPSGEVPPDGGVPPGTISVKIFVDVNGWPTVTKCRRNIAENYNRLYGVGCTSVTEDRQTTDDRWTDGRQLIANVNVSSCSLKTISLRTRNHAYTITQIVRRSSQGNPSVGGGKHKRGSQI